MPYIVYIRMYIARYSIFIYNIILGCTAIYSIILGCTAIYNIILECTTIYNIILECTAIYNIILGCTAISGFHTEGGVPWDIPPQGPVSPPQRISYHNVIMNQIENCTSINAYRLMLMDDNILGWWPPHLATTQNASESTSENVKIKNFLGGHAPRPP